MRLDDDAQLRAVQALRAVRRSAALTDQWLELNPVQQLGYVISVLLDLPAGCCTEHDDDARAIIRLYLGSRKCAHVALRRRACEILTAVAIVDGHPPCVVPGPQRFDHGTS